MTSFSQTFVSLVGTYGLEAVLVLMAAESCGLPFPSDPIMPAGGHWPWPDTWSCCPPERSSSQSVRARVPGGSRRIAERTEMSMASDPFDLFDLFELGSFLFGLEPAELQKQLARETRKWRLPDLIHLEHQRRGEHIGLPEFRRSMPG